MRTFTATTLLDATIHRDSRLLQTLHIVIGRFWPALILTGAFWLVTKREVDLVLLVLLSLQVDVCTSDREFFGLWEEVHF